MRRLCAAASLLPLAAVASPALGADLILNVVGAPETGGPAGVGQRAVWRNAGTVGGVAVDLAVRIVDANQGHTFTTQGSRPAITSTGQDHMWMEWTLYSAASAYNVVNNTGGVEVAADVHIQLNDIDGPANEQAFVPVCDGSVGWVRIDQTSQLGRTFGTVGGYDEVLSVIGDKTYNSEPVSGLEVFYPNTSRFRFGRTANANFFIRVDSPSYGAFNTLDYTCADHHAPTAVDDQAEGQLGNPVTVEILLNDSIATSNTPPVPGEYGMKSVVLVAPGGATGQLNDGDGHLYQFSMPGEGQWTYDETSGELTFAPAPGFVGTATPIHYRFRNALNVLSNQAAVSVVYPAIGIVKSATLNDEVSADGHAQVGETIGYTYHVTAPGAVGINGVAVAETGFTGAGVAPAPAYQSGDANANNRLDPGETWVYTASYTLVAADLVTGDVRNQATATGTSVGGLALSDLSDSVNAADGNGVGTAGPGANNDDVTVSVLSAAPINAADDTPAPVNGAGGAANVVDVLANDTLDGNAATTGVVTLTVVTPAAHAGVTLAAGTGIVSVAAATPAGTYTIDYRICETLSPANCDTATVTVEVEAAAIDAVDDAPPKVSGIAGGANIVDVLANDTLDGAAAALADVTLTVVTPAAHGGVTLDTATGMVSVAAATPAGTYTIDYRICENLNPANCDTATVTVEVDVAAIDAVDDAPPVASGIAGGANIADVLANDTLAGAAAVLADVTLTIVTPAAHGGITLDTATGMVSVAAATPAGTYTIDYRICENLNPANCDTATVTVEVDVAAIDAVDDAPPMVSGIAGGANIADVLANDALGGAAAVLADVTLTIVTPAAHGGITLDTATGMVSVAAGTPSGSYSIVYGLCENLNPANCDTATVTVEVDAAAIDAVDDLLAAPVDSAQALAGVINVLANDRLGGAQAAVSNVNVAAAGALPAGFTLSMQGAVDIAQGTNSGDYSFQYRICEILNPANCAVATVSIAVRKTVPAISGIVFFDANGNGVLDGAEQRLPGYRVELRRGGEIVRETTSGADGGYHIFDFAPGAGYELVFIDPDNGMAAGRIANLTFAIDQVMSEQNQPIDPSGVVYNVVTGAPLAGVVLEFQTAGGTVLPAACLLPGQQRQTTGADGRYRFDVVPGGHALCPAAETEYRLAVVGWPAGIENAVSRIAPPQPGALDATACPVDAVPGGACQLSADNDAPAGGAPEPYYLAFLLAPGDPHVVNNHIPLDPLPTIPATGLSVVKRAGVAVARRDEVVSYVIVAANANGTAAGPLDVVDRLPPGFAYVPGSARLDGAAATPQVSGRSLVFSGLRLPARGSVEIRLFARIGADVAAGEQVNEAWMRNPATGAAVSNVGRAAVRVLAEHVFDCADVTGKVFDDRNRDGWQDPGEAGLPSVRIVTVQGMLVTTDRHGRFSVPCAALPDPSIGSNIILKLDTRTLPQGYAVTTENPRVARLTAGKATVMNFGATAGRFVDVEISGHAFHRGSARPGGELQAGLGRLAGIEGKRAATLSITYRRGGEAPALTQARVEAVRALLAQVWRDGRKALPFEIRVVGAK